MKREFLESFGLEKEVVEKIMVEHGKTVQSIKSDIPEDYTDLKNQIKKHDQIVQGLNDEIKTAKDAGSNFETEKQGLLDRIAKFESNELKIRVARENNIPFELANKLSGETEEELISDAKTFSEYVNKKDVLPLKGEKNGKTDPYAKMAENL